MGGTSKSKKRSSDTAFDPEALRSIIQQLQGFSGGGGNILSGGLTEEDQQSIQQQLSAIEQGAVGAEQTIEQTVRERAAATGFGGSSTSQDTIIDEAVQLAGLDQFQSQQKADVFGQAGQLRREGAQINLGARRLQFDSLLGAGRLAGIGQKKSKSSSSSFNLSGFKNPFG